MNKLSKIKERIKYFADKQSVTKEVFFTKIGMTSASFRGDKLERPINSDAIEKIITIYPSLNLHWLITGEGEMIKTDEFSKVNEDIETYNNYKDLYLKQLEENTKLKDRIIELMDEVKASSKAS